jgi:hypothetical protein
VALVAAVALLVLAVVGFARARGDFDATVAPPDDLRRADDGYQPGLSERDGTGGFL